MYAAGWRHRVVSVARPATGSTRTVDVPHDIEALTLTPDGLLVAAGYDGITCWECDLHALP